MFGAIKAARQANKPMRQFVELYDHPDAYRPGPLQDRSGASPKGVLHGLADVGNGLGMHSGDVACVAVSLLRRIDERRGFDEGLADLLRGIAEGQVSAVNGEPLRDWVEQEAVITVSEMLAVAARPEAFSEALATESPDAARGRVAAAATERAQVAAMLEEYAYLRKHGTILTELQRADELRGELERLGVDVDEALELDRPFQTPEEGDPQ